MILIKQTVERVGPASYKVLITIDDAEYEFTYEKTNSIFPAYKSLFEIMKNYRDIEIILETNSEQLAEEISKEPNRNTTLLNIFRDIVERNNLSVAVK